MFYADDRQRQREGDGKGRVEEPWDEAKEGDTTRLSTLDVFRRQLDESGDEDEIGYVGHSEDEGECVLHLSESKDERESRANGDGNGEDKEDSDGEVGIGLSLMGALGGEDHEDEDREDDAEPAKNTNENSSRSGDVKMGTAPNGTASSENGGSTPMPWTRYTPTSPISPQSSNDYRRRGEEGDSGDQEEDEEDGAYWDDIYDDYRYSRYSLASKRFSAASKASGTSKASSKSSKTRANAPPMPSPPDRPSFHASQPSTGSDGPNGYPRPSFESASSSISTSMPFARPSLTRTASDESTHELPLTAQFPAVPVHMPVRTESRLRIVHDGYTQGGDGHGEREQRVTHGSTEDDNGEMRGLNIEVIEAAEEEGAESAEGQEVVVGLSLGSLNANGLSPLLHTTFGSPHSSRYTDLEEGSDQDHGRRYSNRSGKSTLSSSVEGPPKSAIDGGGMASALREKMEAERMPSSGIGTAPSIVVPDASPSEESGVRAAAIVVDDEQGQVTGINIDNPVMALATGTTSMTPNAGQTTVVTDPTRARSSTDCADDDAEKNSSPFLRPRPPQTSPNPSHSPHAHPFARTSMFLPHPNAPKVVPHHQSQGPMYGRATTQAYTYPESGMGNTNTGQGRGKEQTHARMPAPPGTTVYSTHILHQLRSATIAAAQGHSQGLGPGQGHVRRPLVPPTLFARCQFDLGTSTGPVPILFSLDPLPPPPPTANNSSKVGGGGKGKYTTSAMPTRAATVSAPVRRGGGESGGGGGGGAVLPSEDPSLLRLPKRSPTTFGSAGGPLGVNATPSLSIPIPREGFVPKVGAARPRSRSFSAFGANVAVAPPPERRWAPFLCVWFLWVLMSVGCSREEPVMRPQGATPVGGPSRNASLPPALVARHAPSPLVLQASNKGREPNGILGSPVVQSPVMSPQFKMPFSQEPAPHSPLFGDVNGSLASPVMSSPLVNTPDRDGDKDASSLSGPPRRTSTSPSDPRNVASPQSLMPGRKGSSDVPPRSSSIDGPRQSSDSSESRSLVSPPPIPEAAASQNARSSPLTQEHSLRSKLSLPALRMKAGIRPSKVDDAVSVASLAGSGENETVQVQDMDFELVKPSLPQVTTGRASQESTRTGWDVDGAARPDASPTLGDAASMHSSAPRSPLVPAPPTTVPVESAESIDAHRQRELKWMALFPAVPPAQARKNKKVRKLLQEGVPSSVRYLVWCHLTDSKARALPGVYAKLVKRPRVPAFAETERDVEEGFPDQPQLHTARGPLVSLLQAYLSMVPDIQYSSGKRFSAVYFRRGGAQHLLWGFAGLTYIAGHLLLLAPEEDAFWIFASMMDAHLRGYFSTNTVQIEIDASLFSRALEAMDPVLTKKLYVQLSIAPASITRPWCVPFFLDVPRV